MHVSKRSLGVNYVVGTGLVLGGLLLAQLLRSTPGESTWSLLGFFAALALVSAVYWLPRVEFTEEQIWTVAQGCALGIGATMLVLTAVLIASGPFGPASTLSIALASTVAVGAMGGVLAAVAWELSRTVSQLRVRNGVLNRVLRHNLRNDMTVVLGHLEHIKRDVAAPQRAEIETCQLKVDTLLELTEKIRQIDVAMERGERRRKPVDAVGVINHRIDNLRRVYPEIDIEADLPEEAWVYADDLFGTVLDNVIESAVVHSETVPELHVTVTVDDAAVEIRIEDDGHGFSPNDLTVVSAGRETELEHSEGIELWLVDWLVSGYGGDVAFDSSDRGGSIAIELQRATRRESSILS